MERKNCRIKEDYDGIKMRAEKISEAMNWRINDWNKIDEIKKERDLYQDWRRLQFQWYKNEGEKMIKCWFKWWFGIKYKLKKIENWTTRRIILKSKKNRYLYF